MKYTLAIAILFLTPSSILSLQQERSQGTPPEPFENHGACPFECCTYRTWSVEVDTDVLEERRDDAPIAFRVRRGESVVAVTGVVVTNKLGRAVVRKAATLGGGQQKVDVEPGDTVFVLHYMGEGYWRLWVRGFLVEDGVPRKNDECISDSGERGCTMELLVPPQNTWWVKVRSRGRIGWTRLVEHFGNIDACG